MKKILFTAILIWGSIQLSQAQQDAQYTQYMYNTMAINPGYAGSRGVFSIAALHRSQWLGLDGAPTTQSLNLHSPVGKRVGLGLSVVNDEIGNGTSQETNFDLAFSYAIPINEQGAKLALGLNAGGQLFNLDFNKLRNYDPSVGPGVMNIDQKFTPNIGAGAFYYTNRFYAGLSVPHILETEHFDNSGSTMSYVAEERMNWYLITGMVFDLNPKLKFKPAALFRAVEGAPLQADISANFLFNDKFRAGLAYRWDSAVSALVGLNVNNEFLIGLAYDRETTKLGNSSFNDGSFEIFVRYEFIPKKERKIITPRFF